MELLLESLHVFVTRNPEISTTGSSSGSEQSEECRRFINSGSKGTTGSDRSTSDASEKSAKKRLDSSKYEPQSESSKKGKKKRPKEDRFSYDTRNLDSRTRCILCDSLQSCIHDDSDDNNRM